MRCKSLLAAAFGILLGTTTLWAQGKAPSTPWRGAGPTPCVGSDGGVELCPPAPRDVAVRAGRMFDSKTGQMLASQVMLLSGERITAVGPESQVKIPAGIAGDRPQPGDSPAGFDRRPHAHVQRPQAQRHDGRLHADRRSKRAGQPARWIHRRARYDHAWQRLRRRRDPQCHQ